MTTIVVTIRIVHNAAVTFLVASFGFMVAAAVAHNTWFPQWSDSLIAATAWNSVLAASLYALLGVLLVGEIVVGLIAYLRRSLRRHGAVQ